MHSAELVTGVMLQLLVLLAVSVEGGIECICTTDQCKEDEMVTCTALSHCYVQYVAKTMDDVGKFVIHGCIDESQPLLCDNKRPLTIHEAWPVLYCCQKEFCNRDVTPTAPPWLVKATAELRRNKSREHYLSNTAGSSQTTLEYNRKVAEYNHQNRSRPFSINPIFIGVPVAGACVLLAIVIFAIFLLRRKNQQYFRRNYGLAINQANQQQDAKANNNGQQTKYESERTSASSESKLLMKV